MSRASGGSLFSLVIVLTMSKSYVMIALGLPVIAVHMSFMIPWDTDHLSFLEIP